MQDNIAKKFEIEKRNFTKAQDFIDFVERNSPLDYVTESKIDNELERHNFVLSDIDFTPKNVAYFFGFKSRLFDYGYKIIFEPHSFFRSHILLKLFLKVGAISSDETVDQFEQQIDFPSSCFSKYYCVLNTYSKDFYPIICDIFAARKLQKLDFLTLKKIAENKHEIPIPPIELQSGTLIFEETGETLGQITKG